METKPRYSSTSESDRNRRIRHEKIAEEIVSAYLQGCDGANNGFKLGRQDDLVDRIARAIDVAERPVSP